MNINSEGYYNTNITESVIAINIIPELISTAYSFEELFKFHYPELESLLRGLKLLLKHCIMNVLNKQGMNLSLMEQICFVCIQQQFICGFAVCFINLPIALAATGDWRAPPGYTRFLDK